MLVSGVILFRYIIFFSVLASTFLVPKPAESFLAGAGKLFSSNNPIANGWVTPGRQFRRLGPTLETLVCSFLYLIKLLTTRTSSDSWCRYCLGFIYMYFIGNATNLCFMYACECDV